MEAYAKAHGVRIVDEFYGAALSGADPIEARPGCLAILAWIASNGIRCVVVETPNRVTSDLIVQETGWRFLLTRGIELIAADSPEAFVSDTPTAVLIRQILGAVSQFEKASLVAKLRPARGRRRREVGKCECRPGYAELQPEIVALAREPRGAGSTSQAVCDRLAEHGMFNGKDRPFAPAQVAPMLKVRRTTGVLKSSRDDRPKKRLGYPFPAILSGIWFWIEVRRQGKVGGGR